MKSLSLLLGAAVAVLASTAASASENGRTVGGSILGIDGMSYFDLPPPGAWLLNYTGVSDSRRFVNNDGDNALPGANVNTIYNTARFSLLPDLQLLGADWAAFEIFPTYVRTKLEVNGQTFEADGLADLGIDPFGLAWKLPDATIGFSTTITLPTGSYDQAKAVNIGSNHATWTPQFFYTRFMDDRSSDISVHLMYEHPFSNEEGQFSQINPRGAEYASGDLIHGAIAYRRDVSPQLSVAVEAIGAIQIEDDRIVGDEAANAILQGPLDGNRYEKATIGLSARYLVGGRMPVTLTYTRDVYARNTTENDSLTLRVVAPLRIF